jgi:hypothetical protein
MDLAGLSPNGSEKQACRNQITSLWDGARVKCVLRV